MSRIEYDIKMVVLYYIYIRGRFDKYLAYKREMKILYNKRILYLS